MKSFFDLRGQLQEKTLTPAEKRKREEIAKALERENPKMPVPKKMAIATATAKKVAEDAEPIAEISSRTLARYSIKAAQQAGVGHKTGKRIAGQWMADQKIRKKEGKSSTAVVAAEAMKKPKPGHNAMVMMKNLEKIKAAIKKDDSTK